MSTQVNYTYKRFSFMNIVTAVGSILSLLNWASNYIVTEVTDFSIDKSMVKKLYSIDKNPLKNKNETPPMITQVSQASKSCSTILRSVKTLSSGLATALRRTSVAA